MKQYSKHTHSFQATLAALDAMRKAHQNEVQREVSRFKADFVQQLQNGGQSFDAHKEKEYVDCDSKTFYYNEFIIYLFQSFSERNCTK